MADSNPWRGAPLSGDDLYGDRYNLRRYRDFSRDEHRRFGALYEREEQGGLPQVDRLTEYDRFDRDLTHVDYRPDRRHATEGGYVYATYDVQPPQRPKRGSNRGRGPRGYQRSDERIREEICERLMDDDRIDPSDVEVSVSNGEVTLTGTLRSRNAKRWVTQVVDGISGVKDVYNNIRVSDEQVWPPREGERRT